jgi:ubiquinone/menaquinone biosynthesis C-methylase UbiE
MLERVLEQEIMDSEQDAHEYAAFDNTAVNDEFVEHALTLTPTSGVVLDIGTGPGDIAVLLATRAPGLRVVAIDLGEHMLKLARANVVRAGLADRIEVLRVNAKTTGRPAASFDMVIANSLVHHMPEPLELFREMARIARPGAGIFVKDLHRPESESELQKLVDTYAAGCTPYQVQSFADSLRAGLTVEEISRICTSVGWGDVTVRRCSDRHWCVERAARGSLVSRAAS